MTSEPFLRTLSVVDDSSFPSFLSVPGLFLGTLCGPRRDGRNVAPRGTSSEILDMRQFCLSFQKLFFFFFKITMHFKIYLFIYFCCVGSSFPCEGFL